MGSGINLKRAIRKYGIDKFKKEIIPDGWYKGRVQNYRSLV
jgi:hypothetical protein